MYKVATAFTYRSLIYNKYYTSYTGYTKGYTNYMRKIAPHE